MQWAAANSKGVDGLSVGLHSARARLGCEFILIIQRVRLRFTCTAVQQALVPETAMEFRQQVFLMILLGSVARCDQTAYENTAHRDWPLPRGYHLWKKQDLGWETLSAHARVPDPYSHRTTRPPHPSSPTPKATSLFE